MEKKQAPLKEKTVDDDDGSKVGPVRSCELVAFKDLPEYMKENEYIRGYYRAEWPLRHAFLSLFRWHNETLDVWTHLIGFLLFFGLTAMHMRDAPAVADLFQTFHFWPNAVMAEAENVSKSAGGFHQTPAAATFLLSSYVKLGESLASDHRLLVDDKSSSSSSSTTGAPQWPFFVFLFSAMFCLLTSSVCHLFCCHSQRLTLYLLRMDYGGIAVMIVGSFFPPIYYIFQCHPHWQITYLGGITVMGAFTIFTLLSPHLSKGPFRAFRAMLFSAMGFSGIVPAIHAIAVNWNEPQRPITVAYEAAMAVSYVTGTLFYVTRVPERWKPGFFDLAGHSHQIFHVFVIAGALAHYAAALILMEWRGRVGCS